MSTPSASVPSKVTIDRPDLQRLVDAVAARGYTVVGPAVRDGAIVYDELRSVEALPIGWTDTQASGHYRLSRRTDAAVFGFGPSPLSWKRFLHPPAVLLWRVRRDGGGFQTIQDAKPAPRIAFLGVRACDLHAIGLQDQVLMQGEYADPDYTSRRRSSFVIAVNCDHAGANCFCFYMGTGPKATSGFDLALTEIVMNGDHRFVVDVGTEEGAQVMADVPYGEAGPDEALAAECVAARMASSMGRTLDPAGLPEALYRNAEHPYWEETASRCLGCGNCTMVCPTCFCTTVEDTTDLTGQQAERWRRWDSCFTAEFSYVYGGSVRYSPTARFRQFVTHKLAGWVEQFGSSGCVGCGRCITWCPAGIDITVEARAVRDQRATGKEKADGDA